MENREEIDALLPYSTAFLGLLIYQLWLQTKDAVIWQLQTSFLFAPINGSSILHAFFFHLKRFMMENTALQGFLVLTEGFKRNKARTKIPRLFKFKSDFKIFLKYNAGQQFFIDVED